MSEDTQERDYPAAVAKAPTPLQERFVGWITNKTGYDPSNAKTKAEAFAMGVKLAVALRIAFQASPENKAAIVEGRAARAAQATEAPAPEATAAPKRGRPAKAVPAPAPAAAPATAMTTEVPKPRGRRRAPAASAGAGAAF